MFENISCVQVQETEYEEFKTVIEEITLVNSKMIEDTNFYHLKSFEVIHNMAENEANVRTEPGFTKTYIQNLNTNNTNSTRFGIKISFERNSKGIVRVLVNYHVMCAILVLVASINFLIDPTVVPGRAGLLVTLFLVLTKFFSDAQVVPYIQSILKKFND